MIVGAVTDREAILGLTVRSETKQAEIRAVVDTGFDGYLTLPPKLIEALGLRWRMRGKAVLAGWQRDGFEAYEADMEWDGAFKRIVVHAAEATPLVGMGLLYGHRLQVDVVEGGALQIEALPEGLDRNGAAKG